MSVPRGALHRAVSDLTVGVAHAMRARDQRNREMGFAEVQQQFQVRMSGTATATVAYAITVVEFDYPFYYAPSQRDSDFSRPHFWFGAEASTPISVSAVVTAWDIDPDNAAIIGASVAVGVLSQTPVAYTGVLHLTFQGFAALGEDETDIND